MFKREYLFLSFIIFVGLFFRFYQLSSVPPSPSLDEVSLGYNAYSILHTGRDEFGNFLQVLLRAYDDWRPAVYVYLIIPFIKLFGLSVLSVRLPSGILSMITLVSSYFLAKELLKAKDLKCKIGPALPAGRNWELGIPIITVFLLAISPWHIYISRLGHEVNAGLTSIVVGSFFFVKGIQGRKKWYVYAAGIVFGISFYTYQSEKVFVPLLLIGLVIAFWGKIASLKKEIGIFFIIVFLLAIPIFRESISPQGLFRFKATSAFSNLDYAYSQSAKQLMQDRMQRNIFGQIIDNRRFVPVIVFTQNYFSHFNPAWLFANGGQESFKAPGIGLFYPWEIVPLILGILFLLKKNFLVSSKILIFFSIAISLIAPAITTQAPHAMRAFNMLPMPQIIEAVGILGIVNMFKNYFKIPEMISILLLIGFMITVFISIVTFYRQYFIDFPKYESQQFQYALSQAIRYVIKNQSLYTKIVFSNANNAYQSYMFYLFWSKYNPNEYLKAGGSKSGGFASWHRIGKYEFRPITWAEEKSNGNILYVGNTSDFPPNMHIVYTGYYLDGSQGIIAIIN